MPVITALPKGQKDKYFIRNGTRKQLSADTRPIQFVPSPPPESKKCKQKGSLFPGRVVKSYQAFLLVI